MTDKLKKIAIAGLFTGLAFSICATAFGSESSLFARAASFVGNHYTAREATFTQSGCCEYWIDCNTHEVFFTNPGGKITEGGEAFVVVLPNDDRYVAPKGEENAPKISEIEGVEIKDSQTGKVTDSDGTIVVVDSNGDDTGLILTDDKSSDEYEVIGYEGDSKTVIIPEGTTSLEAWRKVFNGTSNENVDQVETIVVPSTLNVLQEYSFQNMPNLKTLILKCKQINWGCVVNCLSLKSVFIANTVDKIGDQAFNNYGSTAQTDPNGLQIYCEDTARPSGWASTWNIINWNNGGTYYSATFGATL